MNPLTLDPSSLENYAGLLQRLCPRASGFAIYSITGEWISTNPAVEKDARAALGDIEPQELANAECMDRFDIEDGGSFYTMALRLSTDVVLGTLLVKIDPVAASKPHASEADVYSDLVPFLTCIVTELRLNSELDEIAQELTVRYEELNLVYHTEDRVSLFDEGQNALKQLIDNCTDYLNVCVAILYLPEKGLFVVSKSNCNPDYLVEAGGPSAKSSTCPPIKLETVERSLKGEIWDLVQANNNFVVINSVADAIEIGCSNPPYKFLATPVADHDGGVDGVLITVNDMSKRDFTNSDKNLLGVMARKVTKIIHSSYDDLTGLINRLSFEHLVERNRKIIHLSDNEHSLLYLNVDRLTLINDTRGHGIGNKVLKRITTYLKETLRDSDIVARIGGDEFGMLILNCSLDQAKKLADKVRLGLQELDLLEGASPMKITCRVGISSVSGLTESAEDAIVAAHIACDRARELGGDRVQVYERGDDGLVEHEQQMHMIGHLNSVLQDDKLDLYGQLIAPLSHEGGRHVEILLRMIGDDGEVTTPEHFLPAAERYQLMPDVDRWVVRRACQMIAESSAVSETADTVFGVNLSGQSFSADGFCEFVEATLEDYAIPGRMICFEITETAAVSNMSSALDFIAAMKKRGCTFALDDFGAGMSSFGYLKTFPVDYLKIDGHLVKDIVKDRVAESMLAAIHQIGHIMGIKTIAEYVESDEIEDKLRVLGIDYVQGYVIQRPRPLKDQLLEWREQDLATAV